jgi:hypothetical protein
MRRYEPSTPRAAAAIAALAMTVITFGLAVVVPAALAPDGEQHTATARIVPVAIDRVAVAEIAFVPRRPD